MIRFKHNIDFIGLSEATIVANGERFPNFGKISLSLLMIYDIYFAQKAKNKKQQFIYVK